MFSANYNQFVTPRIEMFFINVNEKLPLMLAFCLLLKINYQGQDKETKINLKFVKYVVKWGNNLLVKNNEIGEWYYIGCNNSSYA